MVMIIITGGNLWTLRCLYSERSKAFETFSTIRWFPGEMRWWSSGKGSSCCRLRLVHLLFPEPNQVLLGGSELMMRRRLWLDSIAVSVFVNIN